MHNVATTGQNHAKERVIEKHMREEFIANCSEDNVPSNWGKRHENPRTRDDITTKGMEGPYKLATGV